MNVPEGVRRNALLIMLVALGILVGGVMFGVKVIVDGARQDRIDREEGRRVNAARQAQIQKGVDASTELLRIQQAQLARQPELLIQFAEEVASRVADKLGERVAARVAPIVQKTLTDKFGALSGQLVITVRQAAGGEQVVTVEGRPGRATPGVGTLGAELLCVINVDLVRQNVVETGCP